MTNPRYEKLLRLLIDKTAKSELDWKIMSDEDKFLVSIKENTLSISQRNRRDGAAIVTDIVVTIFNKNGDEVDEFSDVDVEGWYPEMKDLFESARRHVRGADKIIDSILQELGGED